ncbi:MAG TPA: hypothetical protein VK525_04995 [Candidatus Saccharimonadales bacterium]|nr:hypothetical protein [Candidatus Saccharimonadales bacterium]
MTGTMTAGLARRFFGVNILVALWCAAILSGCAANRYARPVNTFRDRTQQTIGVLSDFYSSRNSYEIDIYLQGVAADSKLEVLGTDAEGQPTPLGRPVFSPASIKARLDALNLIGIYAGRLYDLADSKAPGDFQTAATTLGANLGSLDQTFQKLQGVSDPTANAYVGPISTLIGIIGQMYLEHQRDQMIEKAVVAGGRQVDTILAQMRDDMDNVFSKEVITGAKERLALLAHAYNEERGKLSFEQRTARLAEIKAASAEAAASVGSAPASVVAAMMEAHKALVQAVRSSRRDKPANLAALNAAMETWTTQIQSLTAQVKLLIH